ncbi:MAG: heavy-metal-associated domain-containing protein [Chloroflexi bacterium]|nr:heavy-metal-associated domain-containing protein [Chloroflexota bacterium]
MAEKTVRLNITGMTCQGCADTISRLLKKEGGVARVSIDWNAGSGVVVIDPEVTSEEDILGNRVFGAHYSASPAD